jgi:hypothetical protein
MDEIDAEIAAAVGPLWDERAEIERLLARHLIGPSRPGGSFRRRHSFQPDPDSWASRVLEEGRRILEAAPKREMKFVEFYHRLPVELNGSGKRRERARQALMRSGKRVGIRYQDANHVRLEA